MMEQLNTYDVELEDGELTDSDDDGVYKPLPRPDTLNPLVTTPAVVSEACSPLATCHQMQSALEEDETQSESSESSTGESSDACLNKLNGVAVPGQRKRRKRVRRTVMVRVLPNSAQPEDKRARFKKYDIWTAALQEEALTENMRGIDVLGNNDRAVESYDFKAGYRLNNGNSLKRRLSNSTDDFSDSDMHSASKRVRPSSRGANELAQRRSVKSRLGYRPKALGRSASSQSDSDNPNEPIHIRGLENTLGRDVTDVGREIANNLYEEDDGIFLRVVQVLGLEIPLEIYKETQRIEADGGMMIKNGKRRRTPGGVFLFLLKHNDQVTPQQQKSIFSEIQKVSHKISKQNKKLARDRKVQELKKRLSEREKDLLPLSTRKDLVLLGSDLSSDNQVGTLSNPPPSPVETEQNFDFKSHEINHLNQVVDDDQPTSTQSRVALASTAQTPATAEPPELISYDDDFLEVNCADMDFF